MVFFDTVKNTFKTCMIKTLKKKMFKLFFINCKKGKLLLLLNYNLE